MRLWILGGWSLLLAATIAGGCAYTFVNGEAGATGAGGNGDDGGPGDAATSSTTGGGGSCNSKETCFPSPGDGWTGPVVLYLGSEKAVTCPDAGAYAAPLAVGGTEAKQDAVGCVPCSCDLAPCDEVKLDVYDAGNTTCAGAFTHQKTYDGGTPSDCQQFQNGYEIIEVEPVGATRANGCNASDGGVSFYPPKVFQDVAVACKGPPSGAACAGGGVCVPDPPPGFIGHVCVAKAGHHACPPGFTGFDKNIFEGLVENRSCTQCTCGTRGLECPSDTTLYSDTTCSDAGTRFHVGPGQCQTDGTVILGAKTTLTSPCPVDGGEPVGTVDTADEWSVCCE